MIKHKYLEDIGIETKDTPWGWYSDDTIRQEEWKTQREIYGFDYPYAKYFPWDILRNGNFNIELKPTDEEIGCGCCKNCITPIC